MLLEVIYLLRSRGRISGSRICIFNLATQAGDCATPYLVIRHLLDVDMGPIEDVHPSVPVFFHAHGTPGPPEEGKGGQQFLTALPEGIENHFRLRAGRVEDWQGSRNNLPGQDPVTPKEDSRLSLVLNNAHN